MNNQLNEVETLWKIPRRILLIKIQIVKDCT
jgi:hypothetical protein